MAEIGAWMMSDQVRGRFFDRRAEYRASVAGGSARPDRVTLESLLDEDDHLVGVVRPQDIIKYLAEAFPEELLNLPPRPHQKMEKPEGG